MRHWITPTLAAFTPCTLFATYIPPNRNGLPYKRSHGFVQNGGQLIDNTGAPRPDVHYYSEGGYPEIFACKDSWLYFGLPVQDTSISTPDTIKCLRMRPVGEVPNLVDPIHFVERDIIQNFYLPWTGPTGVTGVRSYQRIVYENIFPYIDMHLFAAGTGQRIAFVIRPGGHVWNLQLEFDGQDYLDTDAWGAIRFWLGQRMVRLAQAQAYQVDGINNVLPLAWNASYDANNGTGVVTFNFQDYDEALPLVFEIGPEPLGGGGYDEEGLCWTTYFNGNGNGMVQESTQDPHGNYYVGGTTTSTFITFPEAPGNNIFQNGRVAFACQLSATDNVTWKSFFGVEAGKYIDVGGIVFRDEGPEDDFPSVYIAGTTNSVQLQTADYDEAHSHLFNSSATNKGYIARFDASFGVWGQRVWAAYLGDENVRVTGLAQGENDCRYITGTTRGSLPAHDDQPPSQAEEWSYTSNDDAYIIALNPKDRVWWRTFIGGSGYDRPADIRTCGGTYAKVVVVGYTNSPTFQTLDGGANAEDHVANLGSDDVFIYDCSLLGQRNWATFFGGGSYETVTAQAVALEESSGDLVIGGSSSGGLTIVPGPGWYRSDYVAGSAFIARFSGNDRSAEWVTYVPNPGFGGSATITALCFDEIGNLFVGGRAREDGMETTAPAGVYLQEAINTNYEGVQVFNDDMYLMSFTPQHWLPWWSYYGGIASAVLYEDVLSLLKRNGNLYLVGYTSKPGVEPNAYFPLDDGNGVPFFEDDPQGTSQLGFVGSVCTEALTGMNDPGAMRSDLNIWSAGAGELLFSGLPIGRSQVEVFDASGRLTVRFSLTTSNTYADARLSATLAPGAYLVNVVGQGARKVIIR